MNDASAILYLFGGPVLALLVAGVTILGWSLRMAKREGAHEAEHDDLKKDVNAAHKRITEAVMPKLEALEQCRARDNERMDNLTTVLAEVKEDGKATLAAVQALAIKVAELGPTRTRRGS